MLVYICGSLNETQVNDSGPCNGGVGDSLSECRSGELIAGWAVGGGVSNAVLLELLTYCMCVGGKGLTSTQQKQRYEVHTKRV